MTIVKPFRGVRYNPGRIDDLHQVVSQPYDRISDELQNIYYELSPYNITRIIQGRTHDGDRPESPDGPNVYTRARDYYQKWLQAGVLVRESEPALYAYEQSFTLDGRTYTRMGMIAAIQLAEFSEGVILPHERTHSGPKQDRLRLMHTLEVNPEQVFILYPDRQNQVNALVRAAIGDRQPDIDVIEQFENAVRQRVWVINDDETIARIQDLMAEMRNLIIADGHHRYETALNYRNEQRALHPDAPPDAAFNYIPAVLVSMDDPGLVVLPTHREIHNFDAVSPAQVLEQAAPYFDIAPVADLDACLKAAEADPHAYGYYGGADVGYQVLTLKSEDLIKELMAELDRSWEWKTLTVSVLHEILLYRVIGVPRAGIDEKTMVRYHRDPQDAVDNIDRGDGAFVFFVTPTRMENIRACAAQGEKMPQKSTDFYPKVISGLTLLPVGRD